MSKSRTEVKDTSPERSRKKERDHDEKPEEKKKEKKIKDKKKKKDAEEKEKKKKKKKEKKLIQKEALKEEHTKVAEVEAKNDEKIEEVSALLNVENIKAEEPVDVPPTETPSVPVEEFEEKSLAMNPEPPEFKEATPPKIEESEPGTNPPNPNFKPIPELKADVVKTETKTEVKPEESLYGGLEDTEINTAITEKYAVLSDGEIDESEPVVESKSPKKDEFLAPVPELSKWERDETTERPDGAPDSEDGEESDESKAKVTSEVLKRAENVIFQKAINALRPIEIKKISESRKILYQNPEPKVESEPPREQRKSVNVTINVGRNERNVEITEPAKKAKLDRSKFKPVPESHSPTRLSAKERLGDKVEDEKERKPSPKVKNETRIRSGSPRVGRERRISPAVEKRLEPLPVNTERKVFLEERKKERERTKDPRIRQELRIEREQKVDPRPDLRADLRAAKIEREEKLKERERDRTPPIAFRKVDFPKAGRKEEEDEKEKEKDKKREKKREDKKRKKEHRSRSKSKDRKKKKEKKHKKDKEKHPEKKHKHKDKMTSGEKSEGNDEKPGMENSEAPAAEVAKKQRKNPRLVSDRKRSMLDEASFEPDYSATDSESEAEEKLPTKKAKLDEIQVEKEIEIKSKKRAKSPSSDEESSSSESTSSESESSDESHRKRRKKHKKHKKRKSSRRESSSDTDSYSDSSDSSSEEERHRKKSKKSKKSKKKKKKSKHK